MTHKHEWFCIPDIDDFGGAYECMCGERLNTGDVERRLNATEELSAEEARRINAGIMGEWNSEEECLNAYAERMEEND